MAKKKVPSKKKARGNARAEKTLRTRSTQKVHPRSISKKRQSAVSASSSRSTKTTRRKIRPASRPVSLAKTPRQKDQYKPRGLVRLGRGDRKRPKKGFPSRKSLPSIRKSVQPKPRVVTSSLDRGEFKSLLAIARQHLTGYSAADGFSLRALEQGKISATRIGTLRARVRQLRVLLAQPHDLIAVPTVKGKPNRKVRHELYKFTHQKIRNAKHFIVHKPASNFSVQLGSDSRVGIRGKFEGKVRGKRLKRVITDTAFYLFDHMAEDERDAISMLEHMLPDMPEGFYVVLTGQHGDTGEPVERGQLLTRLRTYIHSYQTDSVAVYDRQGNFTGRKETDTGFLQAITGFRHLSTTVAGMELQMQARDSRRRATEDFNAKLKKERLTPWERRQAQDEERRQAKLVPRKRAVKKAVATKARRKK